MPKVQTALRRGRDVLDARSAARQWRRVAAPVEQAGVWVYFASAAQYVYQLRDWLEPLRQLGRHTPVALVVRDPRVALQLRSTTDLPVVLTRWLNDLDAAMRRYQPRVVLYVNQNVANFDLLAYPQPRHVFLSHGESDKIYMVSNQAKAYDKTFVAGQAAVDRYRSALHDFDVTSKLQVIGRPQLSAPRVPPADLPATDLPSVVYAPTTEGSSPLMEYGSMASQGVHIVERLKTAYRVIFRPHPQSGQRLASHARAKADITAMLPAPHYVDRTASFGWQTQVADALVCDISAIAIDWLPSGKPLVVTQPASRAPVLTQGMLGDIALLAPGQDVLTALREADTENLRRWAEYYFAPGDVDTFIDAVLALAVG